MFNRLSIATSPYLQQHASNPVFWWEWSAEAFEEARERDLPIFLSIGYSACHWCHVMAHESFEDEEIAKFLNANFISIKVDREERPDIDAVYMQIATQLTGQGGWPLSLFLDSEGRAFYAGTYFPPKPGHGLPSFEQLLQAISKGWQEKRAEVLASANEILNSLDRAKFTGRTLPAHEDLGRAIEVLQGDFDHQYGGFGLAPKFPPSMVLEFLLRESARTGNSQAISMAEKTLSAMAFGGIYDQLGGGFARYCVDKEWIIPHFEKMLYDNALLLRLYTHWWRLTGSELARRIARECAQFLLREMVTREGAFASSLDADSEGSEGVFYLWNRSQLDEVLGVIDGEWAANLLRVSLEGTFEKGFSTLQFSADMENFSRWQQLREKLFNARQLRTAPNRDEKVVASWNGLAIAALAEAGEIFGEESWIAASKSAANYLVEIHISPVNQRLFRTSRDGKVSGSWGVLDDYANLSEGFLALFQVTSEIQWLTLAGQLLDNIIESFDDGEGGFFETAADAPALIFRPKNISDGAEPSGWLAAANALITYSAITGQDGYRKRAEEALEKITPLIERAPRAFGWGLVAASALLAGPRQIAILGDPGKERDLLSRQAWRDVSPGTVILTCSPEQALPLALFKGRTLLHGRATAFLCRGFHCALPTNDPAELAQQMFHE